MGVSQDKKQDIWDAIGRLKLRDQIALLLGVIAIGVVVAVLFFNILLSNSSIKFHIPESTLRKTSTAQVYRHATYTDFPYDVQFPGTDFATTVGGTEYLYNEYLTSFRYDTDHLLVLGVFDSDVTISEFYSYAVVSVIDTSIDASSSIYESMVHDEGYQNALPLVYECGKLTAESKIYYLISYLYRTDNNKNLVMMAVTDKATQAAVKKSKSLIDMMIYSIGYAGGLGESSGVDDAETTEKNVADVNEKSSDKYAIDRDAEENMTTKEKMDVLERKLDDSAYALEYPDAVDLEYYAFVSSKFAHAVFYIDYTVARSVPQIAFLKSPTGTKYAPSYLNGKGDGLIYWEIDSPEEGNWLIHLSKNARYGQFFVGVMEKEDFNALYGENDNPQPRDGQ